MKSFESHTFHQTPSCRREGYGTRFPAAFEYLGDASEKQLHLLEEPDLGGGRTPEVDPQACRVRVLREEVGDQVVGDLSPHAVSQDDQGFPVLPAVLPGPSRVSITARATFLVGSGRPRLLM